MRAEQVGDDTVSCAGITAPVPELCRALLKAGHDGGERLLVYHGELEFVVPTIAGAAGINAANCSGPLYRLGSTSWPNGLPGHR
jgi:hypothetical protein